MRCWQMAWQGLQILFLVALILTSCSGPGGNNPQEGCGGTEASVSCLEITSITPVSTSGGNASNVDAFQELCVDPTSGRVTSTEPFADHNATVIFANMRFPTAQTGFDIRILSYAVSYTLNQCPRAALGCPPLTGFTVSGPSLFIAEGQTLTATVPFVP